MKLLFVCRPAAVLSLALFAWVALGPAFPGLAAQVAQGQEPPAGDSGAQQSSQNPTPPRQSTGSADRKEVRLPNGKLQREEILKDEYAQNIKDAQSMAELAEQLRADLEKGNEGILSVADLRKTDEIERLAKKIRGRMRR
jgi:hypothetical protein